MLSTCVTLWWVAACIRFRLKNILGPAAFHLSLLLICVNRSEMEPLSISLNILQNKSNSCSLAFDLVRYRHPFSNFASFCSSILSHSFTALQQFLQDAFSSLQAFGCWRSGSACFRLSLGSRVFFQGSYHYRGDRFHPGCPKLMQRS